MLRWMNDPCTSDKLPCCRQHLKTLPNLTQSLRCTLEVLFTKLQILLRVERNLNELTSLLIDLISSNHSLLGSTVSAFW